MWWLWVAVVAATGLSDASAMPGDGPIPAPASTARVLAPKHYAQERCITSQAPTMVWSSSVGMGKSYGACLSLLAACSVPGVPAALTRFERASMNDSTLQTLQKLLGPELWQGGPEWGWKEGKSTYFFPKTRCDDGEVRQSKIVVFGWSDPGRALSSEYARIVVDQAEQLERDHLAVAQTRLRFTDPWVEKQLLARGLTPRQMLLICNADDPEHWLNLDFDIEAKGMREELGEKTGRLSYEVVLSQPEDAKAVGLTDDYLHDRLGSLEGTVWYDRLVLGRWVRAEGLVYSAAYNPAVNRIPRPGEWSRWGGFPPPALPRYRAFDFGTNDPTVVLWAVGIGSGWQEQLIVYRELYGTGLAPSEWADRIIEQEKLELAHLRAGLADEDEARALAPYVRELAVAESWSEHELGWRNELRKKGVWTKPAIKDLEGGIPMVAGLLKGRRLLFVDDMLVEPDARLRRDKLPTSTLQEFGRYRWGKRPASSSNASTRRFNLPVDRDNHGLDAVRYLAVSHSRVRRIGVWG